MEILESENFTALPAGPYANQRLFAFKTLLLQNIIEYLSSVQSAFKNIDISFVLEKYKGLNLEKNFSPALFAAFTKLVQACSSREITKIVNAVHLISILPEEEIFDAKFGISTVLTEQWEQDYIDKLCHNHIPSTKYNKTVILPILNPNLQKIKKTIDIVLEQIKEADEEFYQEVTTYVTRLKLFNGKGVEASSSSSVFGAIYLNLPPVNEIESVYFAEHIIHETSHLNLEILHGFDKIVLNDPNATFKSPIRKDPRPMIGVFHATFVLSRMVRLFNRISKNSTIADYKKQLEVFKKQFNEGINTIEKYATLTDNGKRIAKSFIITSEL